METPVPRSLAVPTIAGTPFDPAKRSTQTSVRMILAKAGVPKDERRTASRIDCSEEIVGERGSREGRKLKNGVRIGNVLVMEGLLEEAKAVKNFSGEE